MLSLRACLYFATRKSMKVLPIHTSSHPIVNTVPINRCSSGVRNCQHSPQTELRDVCGSHIQSFTF